MTALAIRPVTGPRTAARRRLRLRPLLAQAVAALALLALTGAGAYAGPAVQRDDTLFAQSATEPTIQELPKFVLDAHRAGGLEARENSLSGIERALDSGVVDVVDLDVRRLADGTLGIMHDATVDRVTKSSGPTSTYTLAEWKALRLDIGSWLVPRPPLEAPPTLAEVLARFGDRTVFTVEVKEGLVDEVARLLHERGRADSVYVNTNDPEVAKLVHGLGLRSHLWRTPRQMRTDDPRSFAAFVDLLDVDIRGRRTDIERFVDSGVPRVWAHTVTTRAQRDRALRLGATGVVADDPRYVAGVTDTYPASPTLIDLRRRPGTVQASDRTTARVAVDSQSGPALPRADVTVVSRHLTGRLVARSDSGVSTLVLSAARAEKGRSSVSFVVAAGSGRERRWPGARKAVPLRITGEDLSLQSTVRVGDRRLRVHVRLLDSAARGYRGHGAETGAVRTPAALDRAELRLQVRRGGEVVHRERVHAEDTGTLGDGAAHLWFAPWEPPRKGRYTVRVAQRGPVYRHVAVERRVRFP